MHTVICLKYKIYVVIKFSYERIIIDIFGIFIVKSVLVKLRVGSIVFRTIFFFFF